MAFPGVFTTHHPMGPDRPPVARSKVAALGSMPCFFLLACSYLDLFVWLGKCMNINLEYKYKQIKLNQYRWVYIYIYK